MEQEQELKSNFSKASKFSNENERPKSVDILTNLNNKTKQEPKELKQAKQTLTNILVTRRKEMEIQSKDERKRFKTADNFFKIKEREKQIESKESIMNISNKTLLYELRNTFQKSLAKLNNNDTKDVGYKELVNIITKFNDFQSLRVFIGLISIAPKNCSITAKESQVMLIGVLAQVFQENLIDPLDKPPSILKTIDRLVRIVHGFMKENNDLIHFACAESVIKLYKHSMPKDNPTQIMKIFFDYPVKFIEGGIHLVLQKASSLMLSSMIDYLKKESETQLLDYITPSILNLFLKTNYECSYLYDSLLYLIDSSIRFNHFSDKLKEIYEKLIKVLENPKSYDNSKISCIGIFKVIGTKLLTNSSQIIGFYICDVVQCLKNMTKDRIYKIQVASRDALKVWIEVEKLNSALDLKKTSLKNESQYDNFKKGLLKSINTTDNQDKGNISSLMNNVLNYSNQNKLNLLRNLSKYNKDSNITNEKLINPLKISNKSNDYKDSTFEDHIKYGKIHQKDRIIPSKVINNNEFKNYAITEEINEYANESLPPINDNKSVSHQSKNKHSKKDVDKHEIESRDIGRVNDSLDDLINDNMKVEDKSEKSIHSNKFYLKRNSNKEELVAHRSKSKDDKSEISKKSIVVSDKQSKITTNTNIQNKAKINDKLSNNKIDPFKLDSAVHEAKTLYRNELTTNLKSELTQLFQSYNENISSSINMINDKLSKLDNRVLCLSRNINKAGKFMKQGTTKQLVEENLIEGSINNFKPVKGGVKQMTSKEIVDLDKLGSNMPDAINTNYNNTDPTIIKQWKEIIYYAESNKFNEAFNLCIDLGDDIYLIRLICLTGSNIIGKLNLQTAKKLIKRIVMIAKCHQLQSIFFSIIKSSYDLNYFKYLAEEEQNEILNVLYEYSSLNSKIGKYSASLYSFILDNN